MTTPGGGLARIIMLAPKRRVEMAVPEHVPLVSLLPTMLRHGGATLAEDGVDRGGWVLRRLDGSALEPDRSLAALGVYDGETLVLSPRDLQWPEPAFDDVAEAIAATAHGLGARWSGRATRATGLVAAGLALLSGLVLIGSTPPGDRIAGICALGTALVLLIAAGVTARMLGNFAAAALLAGFGTVYAGAGGILVPAVEPMTRGIMAWQVVSGAAAAVFAAVVSQVLVAAHSRYSVAAITFGTCCGVMAFLVAGDIVTIAGAAAIVGGFAAMTLFVLPRMAMYQAGVPAPPVPALSGVEEPMPPSGELSRAVGRSDELLTGLLLGVCGTMAVSVWALALRPSTGAVLLGVAVTALCGLRSRAFTAVRHRASLLLAGASGVLALSWLGWDGLSAGDRRATLIPLLGVILIVGAAMAMAGFHLARKAPSPHFGRAGDIMDTLLTVLIPIFMGLVLGLFGFMRGIWET